MVFGTQGENAEMGKMGILSHFEELAKEKDMAWCRDQWANSFRNPIWHRVGTELRYEARHRGLLARTGPPGASRVVIIDEGWKSGSISAEIGMRLVEQAFFELDAPIRRVCNAEVPMPYAAHLEQAALPQPAAIAAAARSLVRAA